MLVSIVTMYLHVFMQLCLLHVATLQCMCILHHPWRTKAGNQIFMQLGLLYNAACSLLSSTTKSTLWHCMSTVIWGWNIVCDEWVYFHVDYQKRFSPSYWGATKVHHPWTYFMITRGLWLARGKFNTWCWQCDGYSIQTHWYIPIHTYSVHLGSYMYIQISKAYMNIPVCATDRSTEAHIPLWMQ